MKKIFLLIFLFISIVKSAPINGAGYYGDPLDISFPSSLSLPEDGKDRGVYSNYLNAVSPVFACPKAEENEIVILDYIDPINGNITCLVYKEGEIEPTRIHKQNNVSLNNYFLEKMAINKFLDEKKHQSLQIRERFGNFEFTTNNGVVVNTIQVFDMKKLYEGNEKIKEFIRGTKNQNGGKDDSSMFANSKISIDSHTDSPETLSNKLTALITLNPDYFPRNELIYQDGTIAIQDRALFGNASTDGYSESTHTNRDWAITQVFHSVKTYMSENYAYDHEVSLQTATLLGFIDKKFWGFYGYLIFNLKDAYIKILTSLMLLGGVYSFGRFAYRKVKNKVTKDTETKDEGKLASKTFDVVLIMGLFLVPISIDTADIPNQFIYQNNNQSFYTEQNSEEAEKLFSQSALSSSMIRFFANLGSTWANTVNDYALFAYLRFLESKQKAITDAALLQNDDAIKTLYTNIFNLKKDYDFYIYVCRNAFSDTLQTSKRFNNLSHSAKDNLLIGEITQNLKNSEIHSILNYNKINPMICVNIENRINRDTQRLLADYQRIQMEVNISNQIMDDYSEEMASDFNHFIDFISFISNNYGWISVAVVPPSYAMLFTGGDSIFAYDAVKEELQEEAGTITEAWAGNDSDKRDIQDEAQGGWIKSILGAITGKFIWFVMPGFEGMYTQTYSYISNIAFLDPTYYQTAKGKKGFLSKAIKVISKMPNPGGKVIAGILKIGEFFTSKAGAAISYGLAIFLALMISIFLYTMMITTVTMVVIGGAIVVKITLYFIELMLYYFLTDAILLISIVTQRNEYFLKFLSKGFTITLLTPLLIVLSVYTYILFHSLSIQLYQMLMSLIYQVSSVQQELVNAHSAEGVITGLFKSLAIHSTQSFGEVVICLFSIIIGLVTLFKFKDWVFKIIGLDDDGFTTSLGETLNHRITGGLNPVK